MDRERWRRIERLLDELIMSPEDVRIARLNTLLEQDPNMHALQVQLLLQDDSAADPVRESIGKLAEALVQLGPVLYSPAQTGEAGWRIGPKSPNCYVPGATAIIVRSRN